MAKTTRRSATSAPRKKKVTSAAKPRQGKQKAKPTKSALILTALQKPAGASVAELMKITGWQSHSIRGFLSGTIKKRADVTLVSETGATGRRYRVKPVAAPESAS